MNPAPMRVLVVDDEAPARKRLRDLLAKEAGIAQIDEADDGRKAIQLMVETSPSVVFLDIRMPGVDGFGVVDAVGREALPLTVFVTAYDRYAIQAFEANALDYLLKPFSDERFESTMARVRARFGESREVGSDERLDLLLSRLTPRPDFPDRLVVRGGGKLRLLEISAVEWIEGEACTSPYMREAGKSCTAHRSRKWSRKLDPKRFARTHRSSIVNISAIDHLELGFSRVNSTLFCGGGSGFG